MLGRALQETPSGLFVPQLPEAGLASSGKKSIFEKLPPKVARSLIVIALGVSGCRALSTFSVDATATPPPGQTETLPSILDNAINGLNIEVVDPINNLKSDQQKELAAANSLFIQADGSSNLTFSKKENDPDNPLKKGNLTEALSIALNKPIENINVNNVNPAFLPKIIKFGEEGKLIIQPIVYTNDDGREQIVMFGSGNNGIDWGLVGLINQPFDVFSSPGNGVVVQGIDQMFIAFPRKGAVDFTGLLVSGGRNGAVFSEALYFKVDNNGKLQLVLRDENGTLSGPAEENTPFNLQKDGIFNTSFTDNPVPILAPDLTPTLIPTLTETPTPSVPIIEVDGLKIPDPKASNPELFDLTSPDSPIVQFAKAFGIKPEEVGNLIPQLLTGVDGKQFVVMTTGDLAATTDFNETGTPLLIAEQGENGEWVWSAASGSTISNRKGIERGILLEWYRAEKDPRYLETIKDDYNHFSLNTEFVWKYLRPNGNQLDEYDLSKIDQALKFAQTNNLTVDLEGLIWGLRGQLPDWLVKGNFTKDELTGIMTNHIQEILTRYKGKFERVNIVSEPFGNKWESSFWSDKLGLDNYVQTAFRTAREVDPNATLTIVDINDSDQLFNLVKRLNEQEQLTNNRKLIDAVGWEMPFFLPGSNINVSDYLNPQNRAASLEKFRQNINRYHEIGVDVYITELFVDMTDIPGTPQQKLIFQAELYKEIQAICIEEGVPIATYSFYDDPTIYPQGAGRPNAAPYPRDQEYRPKASYFSLENALLNTPLSPP